MSRFSRCLVWFAVVTFSAGFAQADIASPFRFPGFKRKPTPPPQPQQDVPQNHSPSPWTQPAARPTTVPFVIEVSQTARNAKLIVPANQAKQVVPGRPYGAVEAGEGADAVLKKTRTMFAGLAMSLAVGGFFFISRGANKRNVLLVCLMAGASTGGATLLFADVAYPGRFPQPVQPAPRANVTVGAISHVELEIQPTGTTIKLIVPQSQQHLFVPRMPVTRPATQPTRTPESLNPQGIFTVPSPATSPPGTSRIQSGFPGE